jgi:hypothetical protein
MISAKRSDVTACAPRSLSLSSPDRDVLKAVSWFCLTKGAVATGNRSYKVVKTSFENEVEREPEK